MALCLSAGALAASLAVHSFTLAWTHSIEKTRWEEDWQVSERLQLVAARVRGSGAGMEVPDGAVLVDGVWHYRPAVAAQAELLLTHSPHTAGYALCTAGQCRTLDELLPGLPTNAVVKLAPCAASTGAAPAR
jgi:hypothetical protein